MKQCGFCGIYNEDAAGECTQYGARFAVAPARQAKSYRVGPIKAHELRSRFLTALVLGLMIKVYWGGYGPWPVMDLPALADVRPGLNRC